MAVQSRSGFKIALESFVSTMCAAGVFPLRVLLIAVIIGLQAFFTVPQNTGEASLAVGFFTLIGLLTLLALFIPVICYFATYETSRRSGLLRPFLRLLGWWLLAMLSFGGLLALCFLALLAASEVVISIVNPEYLQAAVPFLILAMIIAIFARFVTFWPALALDEPSPTLGRCFRETKPHFWLIVRTLLCAALLSGVVSAAVVFLPMLFLYVEVASLTETVIQAVIGTFTMLYPLAVQGRLYRVIRGID